jgi:hypothetical protein
MGMITPANWRRPEHPLLDVLVKENQLSYLHIFDKKRGLEIFGAQTRFDVYCVQKTAAHKNSLIIDENCISHTLNLKDAYFIPNGDFDLIKKITITGKENGINVIYDSSLHSSKKLKPNKTAKYNWPIIHTMTKKGLGVLYSDIRPQKTAKVILNFNENLYPYNDYLGKYGLSQLSFGIPIRNKKEGERYINALNTDEFKRIIKSTKWGSFQTDYRMFKYFKQDFYKYINGQRNTTRRNPTRKNKTRKNSNPRF